MKLLTYCVLRLTQTSILSGTGNEYQDADAVQMGSKGRCGSCLVEGKTV